MRYGMILQANFLVCITEMATSLPLLSKFIALESPLEEPGMDEGSVLVMRAGADVLIGELLFRRSSIEGTAPVEILLKGSYKFS